MKEASARIKNNKLLEVAGSRFLAGVNGPANIRVALTKLALAGLRHDQ